MQNRCPLPPPAPAELPEDNPLSPSSIGRVRKPPPVPGAPEITTPDGKLSSDETEIILNMTLEPKHREDPNILRFIASYLRYRDHNQAAEDAGLPRKLGYNILRKPDVHAAIAKLTEKSLNKYGFDAHEVVEKVKEVVNVDPIDLMNPDGSFKELSEMEPATRRAIKKFKAKNLYENDQNGIPKLVGRLIEVELYDRLEGARLLGREKDLFVEKKTVQHDVTQNMASLLLESAKRAETRVVEARDTILIEARKVDNEVENR